jgi:hypothetical protein
VYLGLLGRWPDDAGFDHWVGRYVRGDELREVASSMLATPELARYAGAGDEAFVRQLYRDVLGREGDDEGVLTWTAALGRGTSRGEVAVAFTESPEMIARSRTAPPVAPVRDRRVVAVGDSVMLGAHDNIAAIAGWEVHVDTRGCRQPTRRGDGCGAVDIPSGVDALLAARAGGHLGDIAVIQVGNNGPMTSAQFDEVMAQVADVDRVIWLTLHEPRSYEGPNNAVILDGAARYPNIEVIDWHTLAQSRDWTGADGIHLTHEGRRAMARLIAEQLDRGSGP